MIPAILICHSFEGERGKGTQPQNGSADPQQLRGGSYTEENINEYQHGGEGKSAEGVADCVRAHTILLASGNWIEQSKLISIILKKNIHLLHEQA